MPPWLLSILYILLSFLAVESNALTLSISPPSFTPGSTITVSWVPSSNDPQFFSISVSPSIPGLQPVPINTFGPSRSITFRTSSKSPIGSYVAIATANNNNHEELTRTGFAIVAAGAPAGGGGANPGTTTPDTPNSPAPTQAQSSQAQPIQTVVDTTTVQSPQQGGNDQSSTSTSIVMVATSVSVVPHISVLSTTFTSDGQTISTLFTTTELESSVVTVSNAGAVVTITSPSSGDSGSANGQTDNALASDHHSKTGTIVGAVFGTLLGLAILGGAIVYYRHRRRWSRYRNLQFDREMMIRPSTSAAASIHTPTPSSNGAIAGSHEMKWDSQSLDMAWADVQSRPTTATHPMIPSYPSSDNLGHGPDNAYGGVA